MLATSIAPRGKSRKQPLFQSLFALRLQKSAMALTVRSLVRLLPMSTRLC